LTLNDSKDAESREDVLFTPKRQIVVPIGDFKLKHENTSENTEPIAFKI